jgi:hypothetical protein
VKGERVEITTSATLILDPTNKGSVNYPMAAIIKLKSDAGQSVYLGSSSVTSGDGFELQVGESISVDIINEPLYGIVAATTAAVHVLRRAF